MTRLPSRIGLRGWIIAAIAFAAVALAGGAIALLTAETHLPADAADGKYAHDCCGTIELRGGEMFANGVAWASYVVEEDEIGPYVLPDRFVGSRDQGVELDSARPVVKLRLDTLPHPNRIVIPHLKGSVSFSRRARVRYQPPRR